ncbi:MAG: WD40 repeat domain-containing protein [Spirochaetales bacterium]|nr:WD40 repeat domain-containing protein [Spirochaetales bacterium]
MTDQSEKKHFPWNALKGPLYAGLCVCFLVFLAAYHADPAIRTQDQPEHDDPVAYHAEEGAVFLLSPVNRQLIALNLGTLHIEERIQLEKVPLRIVPTPGGAAVFVVFEGSPVIEIYSAETFELQSDIDTGLHDVSDLSFSPDGSRVYVISDRGTRITEYRHRLSELSNPRTIDRTPGEGVLVSNRRGTRLYRGGEHSAYSLFAQTLEVIEEMDGALLHPAFEPGFTELWGIDSDGTVRVLDERTGDEIRSFSEKVAVERAVVSDRVSFVADDRRSVYQYRLRSNAGPVHVEFDVPIAALVRGIGQTVLAISDHGDVFELSGGRIENRYRIDHTGRDVGGGSLGISGGVTAVARRDGSFACF